MVCRYIEDIKKVHLKSFNYKFSPSDLYMQSTIPSIQIGKKVKKKIENFDSECSSIEPVQRSNYSFHISDSYFDDSMNDLVSIPAQPQCSSSDSSSVASAQDTASSDTIYESLEDQGDRVYESEIQDEFVSSRPPHSARKSIKTVINLSSGRCLNLTFVGDNTSSIEDVDTPSTRPRLSTKQGRPRSLITDISRLSKSTKNNKSRKSGKS